MTAFDWTDLRDRLRGTSVYLVGMMGAGKSTLGRLLAKELGYGFVDTDAAIEKVAGKSIPDIFAESQEAGFRALESQVLAELSQFPRLVVATGGGIVVRKRNWGELRNGLVVWLDVPAEVLHQRLAADDTPRPLLETPDPVATLNALLEQRRSLYAQADVCIRSDRQSPVELLPQLGYQILQTLQLNPPESAKSRSTDP
ncbi:shikimate kinase [Synechococcus sp. PCC 7336]|uniref:shikimate kinase n=1 Tax=Synechococcus sp. PCC 7336 TaxID=195250 RepID=UPI000365B8CC|nr:shikimate kinase [Synechococcus sp. PCC 7336]